MTSAHGRFVWYELMTTDVAAATTFYTEVLGWTARDSGMPGMAYTLVGPGGADAGGTGVGCADVGGLMALPAEARAAGAPAAWIGYVAVDDVDTAADRIAAAGGTLHHGPADIPEVGRFAVVADPQGAVFALFRGASEPPQPPPPGTPGTIGWRELLAADWPSVFPFYEAQFGWTKAETFDMGPMGVYQLYALAGETLGGMMTKPAVVPRPFWLFYVNVPDIDAAMARVWQAGGRVLMEPKEVPGGAWILQAADPQGALFALVGPRG